MGDFLGSVRKSLVFRPYSSPEENSLVSSSIGNFTEKIGSCLRKSKASLGLGFSNFKIHSPSTIAEEEKEEETHPIRWRKGELIGCGAFGHVYMGMNLDSGELLAVKQVLIGVSSASKEKAQAHIKELEEEVKLLKNLSHANIVRYLGTAREDDTLNILLEFVPGGSISSLLGKFGSFPEAVIRMYTKQLLQGLEYLHRNKIIHRDIKGANILVDNKGCIKLADFGASKQVAKLATMNAAKSMKGTPYWMAPEVIVQSGHSFSADIWSVGCTVIEMATGKPPWSQQYQEVAALFHVGTTKSHPPIPEHLSSDAKDFLLKCLQQEPNLRPTASELLQHPFVAREYHARTLRNSSNVAPSTSKPTTSILQTSKTLKTSNQNSMHGVPGTSYGSKCVEYGNESYSFLTSEKELPLRPLWETINSSDNMCQFDDDKHDFPIGSSFNPMSEPFDDWSTKFDINPEQRMDIDGCLSESICNEANKTSISDAVCEQDDEVTETKIRAFLDEKALDLKKLQTPLYEEFFNTSNVSTTNSPVLKNNYKETTTKLPKLPPKSPTKATSHIDVSKNSASPLLSSRRYSCAEVDDSKILKEIQSPRHNEFGELGDSSQSESYSERQRKWKEELDRELEMMRQAAGAGKASSPNLGRSTSRKRDRWRFTSPGK